MERKDTILRDSMFRVILDSYLSRNQIVCSTMMKRTTERLKDDTTAPCYQFLSKDAWRTRESQAFSSRERQYYKVSNVRSNTKRENKA